MDSECQQEKGKPFICYFSFTCELQSHFCFRIPSCAFDLRALQRRGCSNQHPRLSLSLCLATNVPAELRASRCGLPQVDGHQGSLQADIPQRFPHFPRRGTRAARARAPPAGCAGRRHARCGALPVRLGPARPGRVPAAGKERAWLHRERMERCLPAPSCRAAAGGCSARPGVGDEKEKRSSVPESAPWSEPPAPCGGKGQRSSQL